MKIRLDLDFGPASGKDDADSVYAVANKLAEEFLVKPDTAHAVITVVRDTNDWIMT